MGCTEVQLTDAVSQSVEFLETAPKVVFVENEVSTGLTPSLTVAFLDDEDRALLSNRVFEFPAPGPIEDVRMAPNDGHLLVYLKEDNPPIYEPYILLYDLPFGTQEYFATDNTLSSAFETLCPQSDAADPYRAQLRSEEEAGTFEPGEADITFTAIDVETNTINFIRWLDDDRFLASVSQVASVWFVSPDRTLDADILEMIEVFLTLEESDDEWGVVSCSGTPPTIPTFPLTRAVALGATASQGSIIELGGSPLLTLTGDSVAPNGARHVDGPYSEP